MARARTRSTREQPSSSIDSDAPPPPPLLTTASGNGANASASILPYSRSICSRRCKQSLLHEQRRSPRADSCFPSPHEHQFLAMAAAMWTELNTRFNQGNGPRIFELSESLITLHQGDDSVSPYFTKLKAIWNEIHELRPCTPCTCAAAADNLEFQNLEQVLQFLTGLNESYHAVRAQVLLIEPFPSISKVFSTIVQE
ncbi:uncharacterized protein LOC133830671 [Humulus lupulus]|uniref:uncharacterized protein LOC133830671 n=1 Tax=Humulus lupulus TaxID=3486 RepID=UPI002B412396|nr:uncharacterized protein LOC133830671 [Humulus lupulus]